MGNRTALITGASRGIGKTAAIQLAADGFNIVINYAGNEEGAKAVAAECETHGVKTLTYKCDVADIDAVGAMVATAVEGFGTIDVLVSNAGITKDNLILRMNEADFDAVIDVNLKGTFNCIKHVSKVMLKQKSGKIITMASIVGMGGNAGQANYAASKAGVIALTKTTAKEFAAKGITANAIAPGFINSDMSHGLPEKVQQSILEQIPLKRFGDPQDVADLISFLASDKSNYITGQVLCVDGGMSL